MSNYAATVVKITNLRKHSNADRLLCTNIFGNNIIVGLETKEGDLGLHFPLEAQIGEEFAVANDLIRRKDPATGKTVGGMFEASRRVKAQTFRGEKSMGFFIPIVSLMHLGDYLNKVAYDESFFKEGTEIEKLGDLIISQKYIPKNTKSVSLEANKGQKAAHESKIIDGQFRFHADTAHLGKNIHKIKPTDFIAITWKLHGTSAIVSNVLVKRKLSWIEKILFKLNVLIEKSEYSYLFASRRVIKNEFIDTKQHFYGYDLWTETGKQFFEGKLHAGETVYYEIVGFTKDGSAIQGDFDYGCTNDPNDLYNPKNKIFIYRITKTAGDGSIVELQWNQLEERCKELNVEPVPLIYYGKAGLLFDTLGCEDSDWNENFLTRLRQSFVYDQDSKFCKNQVPEEGICLRKEGLNIEVFKLKSFKFLSYETSQLDNDVIDMETCETLS